MLDCHEAAALYESAIERAESATRDANRAYAAMVECRARLDERLSLNVQRRQRVPRPTTFRGWLLLLVFSAGIGTGSWFLRAEVVPPSVHVEQNQSVSVEVTTLLDVLVETGDYKILGPESREAFDRIGGQR